METRLLLGDCLDHLNALEADSVDAIVTDPPAGIAFMGKSFDTFKDRNSFIDFLAIRLAACLRVAKPGARMLCWAIPRTSHWTGTAIEDAGWIIEDRVSHLFGTGFPKAKSKLKPACEDWWLARKPSKSVPALNIDDCRIGVSTEDDIHAKNPHTKGGFGHAGASIYGDSSGADAYNPSLGRWPANVVHDGSDEVMEAFAEFGSAGGGDNRGVLNGKRPGGFANIGACNGESTPNATVYSDAGTAARFYYCPKASRADRGEGNTHPTVKNTELMRWLLRLIAKPGDLVVDPFTGSGSTGKAAALEGMRFFGIESDPAYHAIAQARLGLKEAE